MPTYAIGDGNKSVVCPDGYLADSEGDTNTVLWRPENAEFVIRCSVISVTFKEGSPPDKMRADNREKANQLGVESHETAEVTNRDLCKTD